MTEKDDKHLYIIMEEMFDRVGAPKDNIREYCKQDWWFVNYEWTPDDEDSFAKWMTDYLYRNADARKELFKSKRRRTKKEILPEVKYFVSNYGWKLKLDRQ